MSNDPASPIGSHHQTVRSASDADLQSTLKSLDATEPWDRPAGLRDAIILEMGRRVASELRAGKRPDESSDQYVERLCAGIEPI